MKVGIDILPKDHFLIGLTYAGQEQEFEWIVVLGFGLFNIVFFDYGKE